MILILVTCKNQREAGRIGLVLVKKRLAGCAIVIPRITSFYWWPPRKNKIERSREAILLVKTFQKKFPQIEREVKLLHSYTVPCILATPVAKVSYGYLKWLRGEVR